MTLTAGVHAGNGDVTISYARVPHGHAIKGAHRARLRLRHVDRAKAIQCRVTARNAHGSAVAYSPAAVVWVGSRHG